MNVKQNSQSGMNLTIETDGWVESQATWRFYNNDNVDIPSLNDPIMEEVVSEINKRKGSFVLVPYDWSHVEYKNHSKKQELTIKNKKGNEQLQQKLNKSTYNY